MEVISIAVIVSISTTLIKYSILS